MSDAPTWEAKESLRGLRLDPHETASLLRIAIRRGEAELAERAAVRLFRLRGPDAWRQLLIIAFEDVGIGSVDALIKTTASCTDLGATESRLRAAAQPLAEAAKERSARYLLAAAWTHPVFEEARRVIAAASHADRLDLVTEADASLTVRAIAAWRCSGLNWQAKRNKRGDLAHLMGVFARLGVPTDLILASGDAAVRTHDPVVLMAPLLWIAANQNDETPIIKQRSLVQAPRIDGAPLCIFDKSTKIGKAAIGRFVYEIEPVRAVLNAFASKDHIMGVAEAAIQHIESAPVSRCLHWRDASSMEALGVEADLLRAGATHAGMGPIIAVIRENIGFLDVFRVRAFHNAGEGRR
jgi:hypothetical protein